MARWLPWTERESLAHLLEDLAPHFPERRDFELWRSGALAALIGGTMAYVGTPEGGWLLQGGEGLWRVIATLGEADEADLARIFEAVKAEADLIVWDAELGEGWTALLAEAGARTFTRRSYVQNLDAVAFKDVPEDGIALAPWDESTETEGAIDVLVGANAGLLEGMFLTLPKAPTAEHCREAFDKVLRGDHGAFLPWASFVATDHDGACGALLCVQGDEAHQGVLFELAVAPRARGKNLSRRLVAAMQRALLDRGYRENHFLTMATNAPVHRLFRPEEIAEAEETAGGFWQRV